MPRPHKRRLIYGDIEADYFKPRGKPLTELEEIVLEADEIEALRLADLEARYHNDAADRMGVSRQTFGNIIKRARHKMADALIHGKAIRLTPAQSTQITCRRCGRVWREQYANAGDVNCPECDKNIESENINSNEKEDL